ncbi:MAG TPA: sigma-70 family RNA polymerase sigma factor [Jatrophihabitantaceae bacterium]|jgi:RNA polymerase sigma-70 factor (ECF subfamily)
MPADEDLAARFQADRAHLRAVAFRLLGSLDDADDALQQAWLKASRADRTGVENLTGWLTTVTARECLTLLRARRRRRETALPEDAFAVAPAAEDEAIMSESVGRALLVVLDRLSPPERVAFVLHDMFAVPFDEIAPIVDRSPVTAKKLASRARQKVRGPSPAPPAADVRVVRAFLVALRAGDIDGLLAVLAPDVIRRADAAARPAGVTAEIRGADATVAESLRLGRRRAQVADLARIGDRVGLVVAPRGRLVIALAFTVDDGVIRAYDVIADPARLADLPVAVLDPPS